METRNRNSDLPFRVKFKGINGIQILIPNYDFKFEFYVNPSRVYTASKIADILTNCSVIDVNTMFIAIDSPSFGPGELKCRKTFFLPDERFPDGTQKKVEVETILILE